MRPIFFLFCLGVAHAGGVFPDVARVDTDGNGRITAQEWARFFKHADDNQDGTLDAWEWRVASLGIKPNGDPPNVGELGPSLKVFAAKDGRLVDLFKLKRATVLIFSAWT